MARLRAAYDAEERRGATRAQGAPNSRQASGRYSRIAVGRRTATSVPCSTTSPAFRPREAPQGRSFLAAAARLLCSSLPGPWSLDAWPYRELARPIQPTRSRFAGDPRSTACQSDLEGGALTFEMTHAMWVPFYFPGWTVGAPELEVDDPALVVIGEEQPDPDLWQPTRQRGSEAPRLADAGLPHVHRGRPPGAAIIHDYGLTWFDPIVPVLLGRRYRTGRSSRLPTSSPTQRLAVVDRARTMRRLRRHPVRRSRSTH